MNLWIMRHGEAGFQAPNDQERTLTQRGKQAAFEQGEWLAKRLLAQHIALDKILVSPFKRTQETLSQLLDGMQAVKNLQSFANLTEFPTTDRTKIVETWHGITPSGEARNVLNYLKFLQDEGAQNVLLISHLPLVYKLVEQLTNYNATVHFYPAVIAEIAWSNERGALTTTQYPKTP